MKSLMPIACLLDVARTEWGAKAPIPGFSLYNPGDAAAVIEIRQDEGRRLAYDPPVLLLDARNRQILARSGSPAAATQTRSTLYGLHLAHFAGPGLRWLFFGSGLIVASGVILWAIKERPKHAKAGRIGFGLRLVDALNIGAVAGLPIAFAAYFWGKQLIPVSAAERPEQEAAVFFLAWAAALLGAFVWPKRAMWAWQLYLGAALLVLLPLLNALTTDAHLGKTVPAGDWALAGVAAHWAACWHWPRGACSAGNRGETPVGAVWREARHAGTQAPAAQRRLAAAGRGVRLLRDSAGLEHRPGAMAGHAQRQRRAADLRPAAVPAARHRAAGAGGAAVGAGRGAAVLSRYAARPGYRDTGIAMPNPPPAHADRRMPVLAVPLGEKAESRGPGCAGDRELQPQRGNRRLAARAHWMPSSLALADPVSPCGVGDRSPACRCCCARNCPSSAIRKASGTACRWPRCLPWPTRWA